MRGISLESPARSVLCPGFPLSTPPRLRLSITGGDSGRLALLMRIDGKSGHRWSTVGLDPAHDVGCAHRAGLACHFATVFKQRKRRNALDPKPAGRCLLLVCIQFPKTDGRFKLESGLLERRCHHLARTTPRRPEVHDQGNVASANMRLEVRVRQLDRVTGEQRLPAFAAEWIFSEALDRDPVHRRAMGTNNVRRLSHGGRNHEWNCSNFGAHRANSSLSGEIVVDATIDSYCNDLARSDTSRAANMVASV